MEPVTLSCGNPVRSWFARELWERWFEYCSRYAQMCAVLCFMVGLSCVCRGLGDWPLSTQNNFPKCLKGVISELILNRNRFREVHGTYNEEGCTVDNSCTIASCWWLLTKLGNTVVESRLFEQHCLYKQKSGTDYMSNKRLLFYVCVIYIIHKFQFPCNKTN